LGLSVRNDAPKQKDAGTDVKKAGLKSDGTKGVGIGGRNDVRELN
jgi:hypothetical protein